MANAYFDCVNANGGINGHPIKLYIETEQTNPAQIAADAKQLVQTDHVVGIIGNTSIIECSVDSSYWQKLGYYIIDSGIAPECYSTPNSAAVNMGPRYSSDGAVQYALAQHASKIVFDQSNVPGTGYIAAGPAALAKAANVPIVQLTENVPISDADSVAIKEVDDAGPNGAVVLNFTPPEALVILQAAQKLGLEDRVKLWGCSTPCNTDFLAASLGPKWNSKLFVNAELTPPDVTNTPTMNLYKAILKQYGTAVSGGIGSFSQMGFTEAEIAVHALESITGGSYTVASVNSAFKAVSGFNTGMLCQLWTYGSYSAAHPEQRRLHGHARQRQDGDGPGLHADLVGRPADRAVPERRRHRADGPMSLVISWLVRYLLMPSWQDFQPFIVSGLALGGVYALSGVGLVVLYRATGVLYLAFGAVGAMGALIAWSLITRRGCPGWLSWLACVVFAAAVTLGYGIVFGPALARRDPLVKAVATIGLTLILYGLVDLLWTTSGGQARSITLPTDNSGFMVGQVQVTWTQVIALAAGVVLTVATGAFLRYTKLGTAMRAMANDREITATLGVPVRRVEAAAWLGCGVLAGVAGLLLANLVALDATTLTFLVISSLAAVLIARLRSITVTFVAAIVIGLLHDLLTPITSLTNYRDMTPFVIAAVALLVLSRHQVMSQSREEA